MEKSWEKKPSATVAKYQFCSAKSEIFYETVLKLHIRFILELCRVGYRSHYRIPVLRSHRRTILCPFSYFELHVNL